jgi:transposase
VLLRNQENLDQEAAQQLEQLRETYADLSTAYSLKESLRGIYRNATDRYQAERILTTWCMVADLCGIPEMKTMARTIRNHSEGILAYWTHGHLTSASMEGFNNKLRWLIRQAYGYRDEEYFTLKIYDLPNIRTERDP